MAAIIITERQSPHVYYLNTEKSWRLAHDHEVAVQGYTITIPQDFSFDLASVPRLFWIFIGPHELSIEASLVHDYIYNKRGCIDDMRIKRKEADMIFLALMRLNGVGRLHSAAAYIVVRAFGYFPWIT